jgi:signal transduction histidine kinase
MVFVGGSRMRNIINELLTIEKAARESLHVQEPGDVNAFIQREIEFGTAALERDAELKLTEMERELLRETAERLAQIETEYEQKEKLLIQEFTDGREVLVAQILRDVLYG